VAVRKRFNFWEDSLLSLKGVELILVADVVQIQLPAVVHKDAKIPWDLEDPVKIS